MKTSMDGATERFLSDLERVQGNVMQATQQISSGRRVSTPSDDPDQVAPLLQIRAERQRMSQMRSNLTFAKAEAKGADDALAAAVKLMDRAVSLATQAASSVPLDASDRKSIAQEIESVQRQMAAYSRTAVAGRFLFSGDSDTVPAYELDLAQTNGVNRLVTADATRRIEDPAGGSFQASMTAEDIFDHRNPDDTYASDNVFAALNDLRLNLLADDVDGIQDSISSLKLASERLNEAEVFYGNLDKRIQEAAAYAEDRDVSLQTQLSDREDADIVEAAIELTRANVQIQAMLQMRASLRSRSLFDYLD